MTLPRQGTAAARKEPGPGLGIEHLGGAAPVATTFGKLRPPSVLDVNAAGVLTVSGDASCGNSNLIAREASLSQAASNSQVERHASQKSRFNPGGSKPGTENGGSSIDAEIATLERLNQQDSKLCDDLRAACSVNSKNANNAKGGGGSLLGGRESMWSLVQAGLPKDSLADRNLTTPMKNCDRGDDDDGRNASGSKKRVFSKYDEETTSILTEWFLSHKRWPYPAAKEKDALAEATNLTTLQISNWFTNKRKRHWTPVIKKRTRSPRDFFEFCVMNPKDHSLTKPLPPQQQQPPAPQPQPQPQMQHHMQTPQLPLGGDSPYAVNAVPQRGINGMHVPIGDMRSAPSAGHPGAAHGFPSGSHGGLPGFGFDGRPPATTVTHTNGVSLPGVTGGWTRPAGNMDPKAGGGGPLGWLDHSRPQQPQQQTQQQQQHAQQGQQQPGQQQQAGGTPRPGALAPGLVYASTAARQAANMDNPNAHHQVSPWLAQLPGMDRRAPPMAYADPTGHRPSQTAPAPAQHVDESREASRMRAQLPHYAEIRGFDTNTASTYQQGQQGDANFRRRDQASGPSQPSQQQQLQQQQQQQQQLSQHPRVSKPLPTVTQQPAVSMPATPAQQAASAANAALWSSYRAPSPRNLVGPPAYTHRGAADSTQQRFLEPPISFYSKGPAGDVIHYPSVPSNANAGGPISGPGGDYSWRDPSARPEAFPPIAAFATGGGQGTGGGGGGGAGGGGGGNGLALNSMPGTTGTPSRTLDAGAGQVPTMSSDTRALAQQQLQQPQQQSQTPQAQQQHVSMDSNMQYWERSFGGRGWPPAGAGGAALPPPQRSAAPSDFQRPLARPSQTSG